MLASLGARVAGDDLAGLDELAAEQAGDHRLGHDAGADGRDRALRQGGHRRSIAAVGPGAVRAVRGRRTLRRARRRAGRTGPVVVTSTSSKPARAKRRLELAGLAVDLDDRELAAVVEAADRSVVGRRRVVGGARLRVRQRVDEGERARPASASAGRGRGTSPVRSRGTWLSQKPEKSASTWRSGSAHASRTWRWARRPWATSRSRARSSGASARVVERQLALRGEERRPPAGARGELDDLAADRQAVEPAAGGVELRVPGRVVDRAARVAAAAQVPVVVLGGAGLVVGDHRRRRRSDARAGRRVGGRRGRRSPARWRAGSRPPPHGAASRRAALGQRLAQPEPQELVVAGPAEAVRAEPGPALEVVGRRVRPARGRTTGSRSVARNGTADRGPSRSVERRPAAGGAISTNASGSKISASISIPSMTRGPGREK